MVLKSTRKTAWNGMTIPIKVAVKTTRILPLTITTTKVTTRMIALQTEMLVTTMTPSPRTANYSSVTGT
jgi:hypothetical protein